MTSFSEECKYIIANFLYFVDGQALDDSGVSESPAAGSESAILVRIFLPMPFQPYQLIINLLFSQKFLLGEFFFNFATCYHRQK